MIYYYLLFPEVAKKQKPPSNFFEGGSDGIVGVAAWP